MKINKVIITLIGFYFLFLTSFVFAGEADIDENALFDDSNAMENSPETQKTAIFKNIKNFSVSKTTYAFSGDIGTISYFYAKNKSSSNLVTYTKDTTRSLIRGNFMLDVRIYNSAKAFLNFELSYSPQSDSYLHGQKINGVSADKLYNDYLINEFFVDANISKKIYLRLGKQFLQWGRCYFWNPSDLINTERRNFSDLNKSREGVFGLKTHIPFGAEKNFYSFIDFSNEDKTGSLSVSSKYEFIIDKTEMAFALWIKRNPVFTYDISSRIKAYDIRGELSMTRDSQKNYFNPVSGAVYKKEDCWQPRCALNIGRTFNYNIPNRISANVELYYNRTGYSDNVFIPLFWTNENLYEPNSHGKYYCAFFGSFNRFIVETCNLNFNTIANLSDKSFTISPGVSYEPFYNFSLGLNLYFYGGGSNKEYTFSGNSAAMEFRTNLTF